MKGYLTTSIVLLIGCTGDKSLTVQNPAPTADIISHDDDSEILEGFAVTLEGVVSDSNHSSDELTTRWVINGEVVCDDIIPDEDGSTFCEVVFDADETEISLEVRDAEQKFGSDTIKVVIVPTEAPIATVVTPTADGVYYSDHLITFEGILSDTEDDAEILVAYWESSVDGVLSAVESVPDNTGTVVGFGMLSEGQHAIQLHVEDSTGKPGQDSIVIDVGPPNSAPLCDILSPEDGSAGQEGSLVTFEAAASDVDVAPDVLTVTWSSDKDGEIGSLNPDSDGNVVFSYSGLSVDTHTISMQVEDEVGATCTSTMTYTVGTAPSITIDTPSDGDVINEGTLITFSATVSDAQDQSNDVALDWAIDGNSISTQGATSSGEATFSDASLTYGVRNLVVTATDTDGLTDSDQITFTINGLPTAPVVSFNPDPVTTSDGLNVSIDTPSVDPEGLTPTYTYEWQLGGQPQTAYTTSAVPSSATTKGEQWTVIVTPNDGIADGASGSATILIENTAPTLSGVSITPTGTVHNDDALTCASTVTDPDESPVPTFEWTVGGSVIGSGATLDLSQTGVMPDDVVTCTVSVVDSDGATATNTVTQTIANRTPTLSNTSIAPNSGVVTSTLLTCTTAVTDDDGESLTPTYTWVIGSNTYAGDTLQLDPTMVIPGDYISCTVDVTDASGDSDTDSVSVTVDNTLPTISTSITANGTTNTGELTCTATTSDVDDATTPGIAYEWFNANGSLGSSNPLQLDATMGVDGDVIDCTATATDLSGGTVSDTASHTITNTEPVVNSISLNPSNITATTTSVTCVVSSSDADNDAVTESFEWYVNGSVQSETTNIFTGPFVYNESITCRVTPNDGKTDGTFAESSEMVQNTPPIVDSISLTPSTVYTDTTITATPVFIDPDTYQMNNYYVWGDFEWYVNGNLVQSGTPDNLSWDNFVKGDSVYLRVTPFDSVDVGTPFQSSTIIVANSAPVITSVTLEPDPAIVGVDDLTCVVTAYDNDFDQILYTYDWSDSTGNQQTTTEVSDASDVFLTGGLTEDTWSCDVTPYDGEDYGTLVAASTTVEDRCVSLEFDGNNDSVVIDNVNLPTGNQPRTVAARYMVDSDMSGNLFSYGSGLSVNARFSITTWSTSITGDRVSLRFIGESNDYFVVGTPENRWELVFIRFDGTTLDMWSDGRLQDSVSTSLNTAAGTKFMIGTNTEDRNDEFFNGKVRDVAIWDSALSDSDIQQLYSSYEPLNYSGIVGLWNLSEGTGTTVYDSSGNGNNGTVNGATWVDTCPQEDLDGDGVATWQDCDDTDASVAAYDGGTAICAAESCKAILDDVYSVGDGTYWINPYGTPYEVECDMTYDGGGWTILLDEDYSSPVSGWNNNQITNCGNFGSILGGYDVLGAGATLSQNFMPPPHAEYLFDFDFLQIDSWDTETITASIDGSSIWQQTYMGHNFGGGTSQGTQICGNPSRNENDEWLEYAENVQVNQAHASSSLNVSFYTNLNSPAYDESWGIDNVLLMVR